MKRSNINKIASSLMLIAILAGCNNRNNPVNNGFDWNKIYKSNEVGPYEIDPLDDVQKAKYGYEGNLTQGVNNWYYGAFSDGNFTELSVSNNKFSKGKSYFDNASIHLENDSLARKFVVQKSGTAHVRGTIKGNGKDGNISLDIYLNSNKVNQESIQLSCLDTEGYYFDETLNLSQGDCVYFVISGKGEVICNPQISYKEEETLYDQTNFNFWGDVHPFYYEGRMYMYTIEAYLEKPGGDTSGKWRLYTSDDMFHYTERDYEVFDFVTNHHIPTLYVYNSVFDKVTFPYGNRDMHMFYDHIADRYVYIGLCYYQDMSSCIGARLSDDSGGMKWSTPMYSIMDFPYQRDPECTQGIFINDRWYLITSIWGESIHSVGRMSYWIGDPGVAFLDNDWAHKERHILDGEDLCAACLVDVGNEQDGHKYMMYGWIPKTSYGNNEEVYFDGTRDHGLWGGEINLPREVYQLENGELASRIDEKSRVLLNKGKLKLGEFDTSCFSYENGSYVSKDDISLSSYSHSVDGRNYISFDMDLSNGNEGGYALKVGNKTYYCTIRKSNQKVYMSIGSPDEYKHPEFSSLEIKESNDGIYHVELTIDHQIFEFHVNDLYSLSARTSFWSGKYTPALYADGSGVKFSNINICKLANLDDIYD